MTSFLPVHQLLTNKTSSIWTSHWDLKHYPNYIAQLIEIITTRQAKRVFIIHKDRAYFLAGLLASLHANIPVVLPPVDAPLFLKELIQPGDCILTDQPAIAAITKTSVLMQDVVIDNHDTIKFAALNPADSLLIFYTSGSTGTPKQVKKRLIQLETEIAVLQNKWGSIKGNFLSTVSHQHLYGLLFSLLWPVCAGYSVKRTTFPFWENLLACCGEEDYIISSPSHLGRFPVLLQQTYAVKRVFSSGSALSLDAAQATQRLLGVFPTEIYGSTESGGIAYRQQTKDAMPWVCFQDIQLKLDENQKLSIRSPYLLDSDWYQTADRVDLMRDNTFRLLERADRVVKVEGKRVCLVEVERRLVELKYVKEVVVLLVNNQNREELAAVVVLTDGGRKELVVNGKMILVRKLRQHLAGYLDRVAIPRKWRFVEQIPMNTQGKKIFGEIVK